MDRGKRSVILATVGFIVVLAFGAPAAFATDTDSRSNCTTTTHGDTTPFVHKNAAGNADTNGTHVLTAHGVKMTTPDNDAKVYGYFNLEPAVNLHDIKGAGFSNANGSGLAPSYQFGLSVNGAWGGTLAWEQTYQPDAYKGTGDVLHGGNSKWYITKDHPGYAKHTVKTWDQILALLPENTTAVYYGLNQGAGGTAENTVDDLKLVTKSWCKCHTWGTKYTSPSASPSTSKSVSPSPSVSKSAVATPTTSTSGTPSLPVTGAGTTSLVLAGVGAVAAGAVVVLASKKRRRKFVAE